MMHLLDWLLMKCLRLRHVCKRFIWDVIPGSQNKGEKKGREKKRQKINKKVCYCTVGSKGLGLLRSLRNMAKASRIVHWLPSPAPTPHWLKVCSENINTLRSTLHFYLCLLKSRGSGEAKKQKKTHSRHLSGSCQQHGNVHHCCISNKTGPKEKE